MEPSVTLQSWAYTLLFVYFPYAAAAVFLTGLALRVRHGGSTVQALSTQYLSNDRSLKIGSPLFHLAIIGVFFGHIFGLLAPEPLYIWLISNETKRALAILMGGLTGLAAFAGMLLLARRRFADPRVAHAGRPGEKFITALILFQLATGLLSTLVTAFSPLEDYLAIDRWAQGLCVFLPDSWQWIAGASLPHKIHILCGFFILLIFPFTKLMHMVALPVRYLLRENRVVNADRL